MNKLAIWLTMAALTATLIGVVNAIKGYFVNPPPYHVGLMVGQVIGFNLIPFGIGGIVFLFKRRLKAFFIGWILAFVVFGYGAIYQARLDSKLSPASYGGGSAGAAEADYEFGAPFAPWRVNFAGTPQVSRLDQGVADRPAVQAEIEYRNGSMCRAEIYEVPQDMAYNSSVAESMLRRLAARDGLSDVTLATAQTSIGPKHSLRGGKTIQGKNGPLPIVFFTQILFADGSFIAMTVGGPASSYPTPEIMHFLNSVKKAPR